MSNTNNMIVVLSIFLCLCISIRAHVISPLLHVSLPNLAEAYLFSACSHDPEATVNACKVVTDNTKHVVAITQTITTICERFPNEKCYCLLESSFSAVSCSCGDGLLLSKGNAIKSLVWSAAEALWQPQYGLVSSDDGSASIEFYSKEDMNIILPEDFDPSILNNCEDVCIDILQEYEHDVCYATCKGGNSEKIKHAWKIEEKNTIKHLKDVSAQIAESRAASSDSLTEYKTPKALARNVWISNLSLQRHNLLAHLNVTIDGYVRATNAQLYWVNSIGRIEHAKRVVDLKESEIKTHETFVAEQLAHLDDEVIREKLLKADDVLYELRKRYVQVTAEEVPDPAGDIAYYEVLNKGKATRKELEEKLTAAETQLSGIQGVILKKGTGDEKIMELFNQFSKEVATLRGKLLKYEAGVVESAALTAKLNAQIDDLYNVTSWKTTVEQQGGKEGDIRAIGEKEEQLARSIRQTKSKLSRLVGSTVDDGTLCDTSSQCGTKQACIDRTCQVVPSGSHCDTHGECGNGHLCISNMCSLILDGTPCQSSIYDCGNGMICAVGHCSALYPRPGGSVVENSPCVTNGDCGLNQDCVANKCLFVGMSIPCQATSECGNGARCVTSETNSNKTVCETITEGHFCVDHSECGKNQICDEDMCITAFGLIRGSNIPIDAECDSGYDCGVNQYCKDSKCTLRPINERCKPAWAPGNGQICVDGMWRAISEGTECVEVEDCGARQMCLDGVCRASYGIVNGLRNSKSRLCYRNEDCSGSQMCSLSRCIDVVTNYACEDNAQCGNGQLCVDAKCTVSDEGEECSSDQTCANSQKCIQYKCRALYGFNPSAMIDEYSGCRRDGDCGYSQSCKNNTCIGVALGSLCEDGCANGQICSKYICAAVPAGSACENDNHCGQNQACVSSKCRELYGRTVTDLLAPSILTPDGSPCSQHNECGLSQRCYLFKCMTIEESAVECEDAESTCGNGQSCLNKLCRFVPEESRCDETSPCGLNQLCVEGLCHPLYGVNYKVCPNPITTAILDGATQRLDYCLAMTRGTDAYSSLQGQLIDSGVARLTSENLLVATSRIDDICSSDKFRPVGSNSFLEESEGRTRVNDGKDVEIFLKRGVALPDTPAISIEVPSKLKKPLVDSIRDGKKVTFYSPGVPILKTDDMTFFAFNSQGETPLIGTASSSSMQSLTLVSIVQFPSQGCLLEMNKFSIRVTSEKRVIVEHINSKGDSFISVSDKIVANDGSAVVLVVKWDSFNSEVVISVLSANSNWQLSPVTIVSSYTTEDEDIAVRNELDKGVSGVPIIGGTCASIREDEEEPKSSVSSLLLSSLYVYNDILSSDQVHDVLVSHVLNKAFMLASLSPLPVCDIEHKPHSENLEESPLSLLHWKWIEIVKLSKCTERETDTEKQTVEDVVNNLTLNDMQDKLVDNMLDIALLGESFSSSSSYTHFKEGLVKISHSSSKADVDAALSKHLKAHNKALVSSLYDTAVQCICDDVGWQSIKGDGLQEGGADCLSHLIPSISSSCRYSYQCSAAYKCSSFTCKATPEGSKCKKSEECGNGMECEHNKCKLVNEGQTCGECGNNQVCIASSCRNAFGTGQLALKLREMMLTASIAQKKLLEELKSREAEVISENELILRKLQDQKKALVKERREIEDRILGAAAVRKGALMKEINRLKNLIQSFKDKGQGILDHEKEEREKELEADEKLLSSLDYENELRISMEKQLEHLQGMIENLSDEDYVVSDEDEFSSGGNGTTRHTNCCGSISAGGSVWEAERKIGYLRGSPSIDGEVNEDDREAAELALCRANATAAQLIISTERDRLNDERIKWEEAVVRLTRPKTCLQLLGLATGGTDGVYTIFPYDYKENDGSSLKHYNGIQVYCDMTTDGGGWTLIAYGNGAKLKGYLTETGGKYNPVDRTDDANLDSLKIIRASTAVSLAWSDNYEEAKINVPNGGIGSYQKAVKFDIPNPKDQTLEPDTGKRNCDSPYFTPVDVTCLIGECSLPSRMYTGTETLSACEGHAYGLVSNTKESGVCDWRIGFEENESVGMSAVYLATDDTPGCSGIYDMNKSEGDKESEPAIISLWVR